MLKLFHIDLPHWSLKCICFRFAINPSTLKILFALISEVGFLDQSLNFRWIPMLSKAKFAMECKTQIHLALAWSDQIQSIVGQISDEHLIQIQSFW